MTYKDTTKKSNGLSLPTIILHDHSSIYLFWGKTCQQDLDAFSLRSKDWKDSRVQMHNSSPPLTGSRENNKISTPTGVSTNTSNMTAGWIGGGMAFIWIQRILEYTQCAEKPLFFPLKRFKEFSLYIQSFWQKKSYDRDFIIKKKLRNLFPELTQKSLPSY